MPPKAKEGKKVRYSRWLVTVSPLKPKLGYYKGGGERGVFHATSPKLSRGLFFSADSSWATKASVRLGCIGS